MEFDLFKCFLCEECKNDTKSTVLLNRSEAIVVVNFVLFYASITTNLAFWRNKLSSASFLRNNTDLSLIYVVFWGQLQCLFRSR